MRFELYTEMNVRECMSAISDRMQAKETATRPALDGWIEKGGKFSLAVTTPVVLRFSRTTRLRARAQRVSGVTIIRGSVPRGADKRGVAIVIAALLAISLVLIINSGNAMLGLFSAAVGVALYVPLVGDYNNSVILMKEVRRALKAKDKPPKT